MHFADPCEDSSSTSDILCPQQLKGQDLFADVWLELGLKSDGVILR